MKKFSKFLLAMVVAVVTLLAPATSVLAAEGKSGETVTVTLSFSDVRSLDGNFTFENKGILSNVSYGSNVGVQFGNDKAFYYTTAEQGQTVEIYITATLNGNAGDVAKVYLNNINVSHTGSTSAENIGTKSGVFKIVATPTSTPTPGQESTTTPTPTPEQSGGSSSQGGSSSSQGSSSSSSGSTGTTSGSTESTPSSNVDYTELDRQIEIAEGLKADGYTEDSWNTLVSALAKAHDARSSSSQEVVDAAAQALADAIAGLVKVDYSKLEAALEDADALIGSDELAKLWKQLFDAVNNGTLLLDSNDQEAVDAAADEINALIEELKALLGEAEDLAEDLEDVSAEPTGKYCDIPMHKVWPILFFISLILNVVLVVVIVRKKSKKDDTPLVDYDISDDDK